MTRALNRLSAAKVRQAPAGKFADGGGLWLHKRSDGGAQWFLRVTVHGRRREMGLGSAQEVSLKEARADAEKWRGMARRGVDPIKERQRQARVAARNMHLLRDIATDAFEARKAELKGDGKAGRWFSPLELHVLPKLGGVPVSQIDQVDIRDTLKPIWHTKADTARKALNRLGICLKHAAALGLDVDLQAMEKAKALLGRSRHTAQNIPAMDWRAVPDFYASLEDPTITHLALRLLILTGLRSAPIRFLREDQIDGNVLTVPAELMKGRLGAVSDFRVPLSGEALRVIGLALPHAREGFLFPSARKGVISDATMSRLMERRGLTERPHGFRSSLRTWLAEDTDAAHEVAETMLGHVVGGSVERAYRRTDYLEQRRVLLERWAIHVNGANGKTVRLANDL
ncbi:integrase arm-type DNA-binding domain-containing protein [Tropicimonas sp. TH_r6]|uniref:tyrosine-type recombinase/integrase n=1 Tax=Tropicimonas sp. TH_r6 TaxID=3082085 RepID=UPI002952BCEF|nr:integrase arm-type DNA-binding domain-containing protein [Tropicimonas sp. TH_r6]MDV7145629.1 integrase arm-type DNA-binding domain-containing protein [Tropicimonas sp. TH_r6]